MLQILSCICVPNLSKIGLLMFPWQHIFESALMQKQPIQLSNDVPVTLFLNQSSQNFELSLEMIISTSTQNFSRIQCFILPWQHIPWRVLLTNRVLKISDDVIVTSFLNQSQQNFVLLFVIPRGISVQNLRKIGQEKRSCKNGKWRHCDVIFKNSSATFCVWVFFTHTYWCTKFEVDWRLDKGITGGGTKHPPPQAENDKKNPGRIGLKYLKMLLIITCSPEAVGLPFISLNFTCLAIKVYETLTYSCFRK